MKKILIMVSSMHIGGVEKSLLSLLAALPKNKFDVTLLLLEKKGEFLEYIPDWVKVEEALWFKEVKPTIMQSPQTTVNNYVQRKEYFKIPGFVGAYFISKKLNNRYLYYERVMKSVPDNNSAYDAAIAYQGPTDIIDFYITAKVKAVQKISWIHFDISQHRINQKLYKRIHKKFNKVFAVSNATRERLIEKIPGDMEKSEVALSIVSQSLINQMSLESIHPVMDDKQVKVVTVGRLSMEKGQDLAISVLARLKESGYNVKWFCVGDGKDRLQFEELIDYYNLSDDFILLGAKKNPYPYIRNADIYVQPSRHEGFCLTLAEAKCLGKPIITTSFAGASEQITDGHSGLIVDFDEKALYESLQYLIDYPKRREQLITGLKGESFESTSGINKLVDYLG